MTQANAKNSTYPEYLQMAFDQLDQGFSIFSSDLKLIASNRRFYELLRFPESLCRYGTPLEALFRFNAQRGEYGEGDIEEQIEGRLALARKGEPHSFERMCLDGTVIEVTGKPMPDGSFVTIYTDITERKKIEREKQDLLEQLEQRVLERTQELKEKTRLLEVTLENISQGISMVDKDLNVSVSNRRLIELLDMPERFLEQGTPFEDFIRYNAGRGEYGPGEVETLVQKRLELARHVVPHVVTRTRPDGITLEIAGQPLPEGGFVTTYTDTTKQTQALQQLKESEQQLRAVLNNATAVIYLKQTDGSYLTVNSLYEKLFHVKQEDIIGKTDHDIFPKDFADYFRENDLKVLESGLPLQFEEQVTQDDGIHDYISIKFPLFNEDQEPYAICGISTDITDRNRSQAELHRLRNYLQNVVDSMPSAIIGIDAEARVTQWNIGAVSIVGISRDDAIGALISELGSDILPKQEKLITSIKKLKTTTQRLHKAGDIGDPVHLEMTIYPLEEFEANGAVIRIDDVTKRIHLEEVMVQSEKMLSVGGLAAGMAHEINNPLAGILQNAQVLKNRLSPDIKRNQQSAEALEFDLQKMQSYLTERNIITMLDAIREAGERASDIVKNMLSFSRKGSADREPCDLEDLVEKTIGLANSDFDLKKKYDFRQIHISRNYEHNLPLVFCSSSKIQQVILNLLKNSAEAMTLDGQKGTREIAIDLDMEKDSVRLVIKDNGPGMDQETRKRVFEPFYTTKNVGVGTGLGLSISYFIITEDHDGEMRVDSAPGHGATFTILLPTQEIASNSP